MKKFTNNRMRRLRQTSVLREMFNSPFPGPEKFIWPVFVINGKNKKEPIDSMPGQFRFSPDMLKQEMERIIETGIRSILIFGVIDKDKKDPEASFSCSSDNPVYHSVSLLRESFMDLTIFTDICLCGYTDHSQCGIINKKGNIDNDVTISKLSEIALHHAKAGATGVAPSAMADSQVNAIRERLDGKGYIDTLIMSYSTKFASSFYGPFREVEDSEPEGSSRRKYQQSYADKNQAVRESLIDESEGADILMVKPGLAYLDIVAEIRRETRLPLAVYNVSGEYSMMHAASEKGFCDLYPMARESIQGMQRAGAEIIISYWANQYQSIINS